MRYFTWRNYFKICCIIFASILFGYLTVGRKIVEFLLLYDGFPRIEERTISKSIDITISSFIGERVVHLDLKGAPPSVNYLENIFPLFHALGVTSVLIEYEDAFPYSRKFVHGLNAYTKTDIQTILKLAKKNRLNVIPLVQTFGHFEFVLKFKKFSYLREVFRYPQSICPSHEDTMSVISGLLDEIIESHPNIRYIHIGADEVYQLGICEKCLNKMTLNNWNADDLFLYHISRVAKYIRSKFPNIVPLMWDDQLRSISLYKLKKYDIGTLVEPVVWFYRPIVSFPTDMWQKYSVIFPAVWTASCFKGSSGPNQILTNISYHVQNQKSWMRTMAEYANKIFFKGAIITGWQRYDHFAVLCELLPVSIPSLVNVALILDGQNSIRKDVYQKIKSVVMCGMKNENSELCEFPGSNIYKAVVKFSRLKTEIDEVFSSSPVEGWFTAYNIKTKYFNQLLAHELSYKINDCQNSLKHAELLLRVTLNTVYDEYTVNEWIETNVRPYSSRLNLISGSLNSLSNVTYWKSRYTV